MNPTQMPRCRSPVGQTLIELLIIFSIIGLIGGVVGSLVFAFHMALSKPGRATLDLRHIALGLELHHWRTGSFPATATGLTALVESGVLEQLPTDPWGRHYEYRNDDGSPAVTTLGADGGPGGTGRDADLSIKVAPPGSRTDERPVCAP